MFKIQTLLQFYNKHSHLDLWKKNNGIHMKNHAQYGWNNDSLKTFYSFDLQRFFIFKF